jgi:hypothetical protein
MLPSDVAIEPTSPVGSRSHPERNSEQFYEWYKQLTYQIDREDGLIHQRLTWMMQIEGLLFTALGFAATGHADDTLRAALLVVLPIVGTATALLVFFGVAAARATIDGLRVRYRMAERFTELVPPCGDGGLVTSSWLPWVVIFAWVALWALVRSPNRFHWVTGT